MAADLIKRLKYPMVKTATGSWDTAQKERQEAAEELETLIGERDLYQERYAISQEEVLSLERDLKIARQTLNRERYDQED